METTPTRTPSVIAALAVVARSLLIVSLVLLSQFLLGIVVNLFVSVPDAHPGAGVADYLAGAWASIGWVLTSRWPYLAVHVLLGLGLVVGSTTFLVRGLIARTPAALLAWNFLGAGGAILAAASGLYFVIHPKVDGASLLMAIGFAVALGSVIVQLFQVGRAGIAAQRATSPESR